MKKILCKVRQNLFGLILGAIVFGSIGVYAATILASQVTYKDNKSVQDAIEELYEKANTPSDPLYLGKIKVGDYVSMTPTLEEYTISTTDTGYTSTQTINPRELNIWRIISINSDGTADAVSEYVSNTNVYFKGKEGYQNYIGTLNKIASSYTNTSYVIRTRHMGYNGQTNYISDTTALDQTTAPWTASTSSSTTLADEQLGGGDMGYEADYNLVNSVLGTAAANKVGTTIATAYWLASRDYYYLSSAYWFFYARYVNTDGSTSYYNLYNYDSSSFRSYSYGGAIRPIITLKSGLTTSGGSGTSSSPWTFS